MQRQVVVPEREIDVVGVGLPLDVEPEEVHVELLHRVEIPGVEREMAKAGACAGLIHMRG